MSRLEDGLLISKVSIPGVHDACTGQGFTSAFTGLARHFGVTQSCTLGEQFHSGIRAFDMRPAVVGSVSKRELHVFHGAMQTNMSFEAALRLLIDSLSIHPSEFVVIIVRHETDGDNDSPDWAEAMSSLLGSDGISERLVDYSPALTVGEMRGKILLLSRMRYSGLPRGGYIHDWSSEEDLEEQMSASIEGPAVKGKLYVQDYYETTGDKMKTKLRCIEKMIETAKSMPYDVSSPVVINHTSGYSALEKAGNMEAATTAGYLQNAGKTNLKACKLICKSKGCVGIIMMDFAGTSCYRGYKVYGNDLTQTVIKQNFR